MSDEKNKGIELDGLVPKQKSSEPVRKDCTVKLTGLTIFGKGNINANEVPL